MKIILVGCIVVAVLVFLYCCCVVAGRSDK